MSNGAVKRLDAIQTEVLRREAFCMYSCMKHAVDACNLCVRSKDLYLRRLPVQDQVHYNAYLRAMNHASNKTVSGLAI